MSDTTPTDETDRTGDTFPRQHARTQRFTLGEPRNVSVSPDGRRVVFLRSAAGDDPVNALWVYDVEADDERLVADPRVLLDQRTDGDGTGGRNGDDLPPEELARRERAREAAGGITAYATDAATTVVAFALGGQLFAGGLISGNARRVPVEGPVFDPRPDPLARRIAYVSGPTLRIAELDGSSRTLVGDGEPSTVSWGSADFVAAEEMGRFRGYWWSPDGETLAVCRVDEAPVSEWTIADPANPDQPARTVRYPAAGTANPVVTLHLVTLDGRRTAIDWDREFFPYVAAVEWTDAGLIMLVQSRDQQGTMVLRVDTSDDATRGATTVLAHDYDDAWVELVAGTPRLLPDGRLLTAADRDGARRLLIDGEAVTPDHLQVRAVAGTGAMPDGSPTVLFQANAISDATQLHVWRWSDAELEQVTSDPGVHGATAGGATLAVRSSTMAAPGGRTVVRAGDREHVLASYAETPLISPNARLLALGERDLAVAVLFPTGHDPDDRDAQRLPVLLDPYGGPHAGRVVRSFNAHLTSQWFAEQGFAVVVADGRGTPGRGTHWERGVHHDLATPVLDDQVDALRAAAERFPCLDLDRVGIRGWSFGGFLAALAVLRRPDVFHAAVAGAPVTDWRLYDTHYTERYLGELGATYDRSSLIDDAPSLRRPLLLVHGLADDNVVAAHTLRLSSALLATGRPHEVLPLVGVTHMTPQETVAENLLLHQLEFLRRSLADVQPIDVDPTGDESASDSITTTSTTAPATTTPATTTPTTEGFTTPMNTRLADLYRGVAVHATADREHQAALELLALVMLADDDITDEEVETLRDISTDWRGDTESFERYLRPAIEEARHAIERDRTVDLLNSIDERITSRVLRSALFSAARDVARVDQDVTPAEGSLLAAIAVRFD